MKFYNYQEHRKTKLTKAILLLENLIESGEKKESEYQKYFEENEIVFNILGYKNAIPFTKSNDKSLPKDEYSGLSPEPDFIVEKKNGLYEIFEIKTPISKKLMVTSNDYRERFSAEIISYIKQTITYENYFSKNPQNRLNVKEKFGLKIQEDLDIKIIVGLDKYINKQKIHSECRAYKYKIDIVTYDEVLGELLSDYQENYGIYENLIGASFLFIIKLDWKNKQRNQYIFDIGETVNKNRMSLFMTGNQELCYRVISEDGSSNEIFFPMKNTTLFDKTVIVLCEQGNTESGFTMSLSINSQELEKKVKEQNSNYNLKTSKLCMGASLDEKEHGAFSIKYNAIFGTTLDYKRKHYDILNKAYNYKDFELDF